MAGRGGSRDKRIGGRRLQLLRQLAISERGPLCERCGKVKLPHELHLHHRRYLRDSDADPFADDLLWRDAAELVCVACHDEEHIGRQEIGLDGFPIT